MIDRQHRATHHTRGEQLHVEAMFDAGRMQPRPTCSQAPSGAYKGENQRAAPLSPRAPAAHSVRGRQPSLGARAAHASLQKELERERIVDHEHGGRETSQGRGGVVRHGELDG